jgi:hypothetical protein
MTTMRGKKKLPETSLDFFSQTAAFFLLLPGKDDSGGKDSERLETSGFTREEFLVQCRELQVRCAPS